MIRKRKKHNDEKKSHGSIYAKDKQGSSSIIPFDEGKTTRFLTKLRLVDKNDRTLSEHHTGPLPDNAASSLLRDLCRSRYRAARIAKFLHREKLEKIILFPLVDEKAKQRHTSRYLPDIGFSNNRALIFRLSIEESSNSAVPS